jgi:hypothetical protein
MMSIIFFKSKTHVTMISTNTNLFIRAYKIVLPRQVEYLFSLSASIISVFCKAENKVNC